MWRKIFSRTTTELSIKREKAKASPLNTMLLMVLFAECRKKNVAITESGMERNTATVARGLPRKIKIINPVSTRPMLPSLMHGGDGLLHEERLIEYDVGLQLRRNIAQSFDRRLDAV